MSPSFAPVDELLNRRDANSTGNGTASPLMTRVPINNVPSIDHWNATTYGTGAGFSITIPDSELFAGRRAGGGYRGAVFGSWVYGSGYDIDAEFDDETNQGRGVSGKGFPFWFWPFVWDASEEVKVVRASEGAGYLYDTAEYGSLDNSSRPGGPLTQAVFQSNSTSLSSGLSVSTFHVLADNATLTSLIAPLNLNCSLLYNTTTSAISPSNWSSYTGSTSDPQPEQAIQYYRASTVVLTLDGYNNTAIFSDENATQISLPDGMDRNLATCLEQTIGAAVPLLYVDKIFGNETATPSGALQSFGIWQDNTMGSGSLGGLMGLMYVAISVARWWV